MGKLFKKFFRDDSGAVTVDWVILTASVVGLATVAYIGIESATNDLSNQVAADISAQGN